MVRENVSNPNTPGLATLLATREPTVNGGKEALTVAQWSPLGQPTVCPLDGILCRLRRC